MATKSYTLPDIGTVQLYKRRGAKHIRLTVASDGKVKVSLPMWAPFRDGLEFALDRREWILSQTPRLRPHFTSGDRIGKANRLLFIADDTIIKPTSRIADTAVKVFYPSIVSSEDPVVQQVAEKAAIRALQKQASTLLPQRLRMLAMKFGFTYTEVSVKKLKARWGSCDSQGNVTLNLFLMQLPWELIDYVLIHELVHTKAMNHGPDFWVLFENILPEAKARRKQIKQFRPTLQTIKP